VVRGDADRQVNTRSHAYSLLKSIWATAVKDELIDRNPCQIDGASSVNPKL
jgi:hypothetical protein